MGANAQTTVQKFLSGAVLTAEQQNFSAATGVPVFATTVTRDAAFGGANKVLAEGQTCYLESTNVVQYYDGAAWATVGPTDATAPVFDRVVRTAGDITTTSTSLVDVTGATVTFTTGAFPVAYGATQCGNISLAGEEIFFNVDIDGSLQHGTNGIQGSQPAGSAGYPMLYSFSAQSAALSAGSHTIKERWRVTAGTGTLRADSVRNHIWWAHEIR